MTRKEARELLMQLLYQMELLNDHSEETKSAYLEKNFKEKGHKDYAAALMEQVLSRKEEIDAKINEYSNKWTTSRMPKVDVAILRLAVVEIMYMDDIPDAVAINEAVDLAKKFGSDESKAFINGILGKIAKEKDA
jgi:N utilization substance protein B